ncbi:NAD(P)-dependent oxidoreductase [Lysinibacter cavernae]|uniref:Phosphoglycerate dehydrogenase-like enzyme n=1 Tax=Lysinibacter cavernae TaxID=1640652 RepID=A0A7X5R0S9_9MICO|nr:NAD(P)-dependent oxidoreductase [Lysinibacter cavernae]NIH53594.1 phosphoglycerate dehydrogenase-like enzyme [Lysinibacter cavernae]
MKILVTPRSMTKPGLDAVAELQPLRDAGYELVSIAPGKLPGKDELLNVVGSVHGWIAGVEPIDADVLAAAGLLRVISRNGVGSESIDTDAAQRLGIEVRVARGANSRGVAELAFGLILSGLREIPAADRVLRGGGWERQLGREIADATVGIVGYGAIGRMLAQFCAALGATVLTYDPFSSPEPGSAVEAVTLDELFSRADVISLHTPPAADGTALVTAGLLATVQRGSILVNTARSALVDADAVTAALNDGRLSAYAVDAFDTEPPTLTSLLTHERTILTPHLGGYTDASTRRATQLAVENLLATIESSRNN